MKRKGMFRYSQKEIRKVGKMVIRQDVASRGHGKPKITLIQIKESSAVFVVGGEDVPMAYFHVIYLHQMKQYID